MGASAALAAAAVGAATPLVVNAILPKPAIPPAPAPLRMPDPLEQQAAREKSIAEMMARRGRQASIVTQPADGKLGG